MSERLAVNPDTGDAVFWDGKAWSPAQIAEDVKGNRKAYDGQAWVDIGRAPPRAALRQRLGGGAATDKPGFLPGVARGIMDVPDAGAQLVTQGLERIAPAGSDFEAWARGQRQQVEALNQEREQRMAPEAADDPAAFRAGRVVGNIAGGVGPARLAPTPATIPARSAAGAVTGAGVAAVTQPVATANTPDEFWAEKFDQMKGGAVGGAVAPIVSRPFEKALSPASKDVQMLREAGVTPTGGQILGGRARVWESRATSLPVVGDSVARAERAAIEEFNEATFNKVLAPLGQKLAPGAKGQTAMQETHDRIKAAYDDLLPKLTLTIDQQFRNDMMNSALAAKGLSAEMRQRYLSIVQEEIQRRAGTGVAISGEDWKVIVSQLGKRANDYINSNDATQKELGRVLLGTQGLFKDWLYRTNPQHNEALKAIDSAYAMKKRVEAAVGGQAAANREIPGLFTPAELNRAVRTKDPSLDHGSFSRGNSLMQDWSQAGTKVLGQNYPNSGTAGRGALAYMVSNPAAIPPMLATGLLGPALWGPGGRKLTAGLLAERGPTAEAMRHLLEIGAVPAGGVLGAEFVSPRLP